jgi:hypothetical protein
LASGVLALEAKEERHNKDRNNFGRLHDGLNRERDISKSLTCHED